VEVKIDSKYLRSQSLFIGVPAYKGELTVAHTASMLGLFQMLKDHGIASNVHYLSNESLIPRARNRISDIFLHAVHGPNKTAYSHHLMLDSDIGFRPSDILVMLALDKEVIGGLYPKKDLNWERIWRVARNGAKPEELPSLGVDWAVNFMNPSMDIGEPVEVWHLATGMMLVKRHVFERMRDELPEIMYHPMPQDEAKLHAENKAYTFFDTAIDPETRYYLSEDWFFSHNCRRLGIKLWGAPWCKTKHVGQFDYSGDMSAFVRTGEVVE
jgi:hypothetical protein